MSASITKGPAFEIRFCEGNKVQVFDLSKRGDQSGNQLLPNEYLEDDVVNGRLRYSKLGNQWLSDDAGTNQHHQQTLAAIPDDRNHTSTTTTTKRPDDELNVIPVVAKRKAMEDAKELESIRQGEEAMRKAMERKKKIEMVRRARQQAAAAAAEAATSETEAARHAETEDSAQKVDGTQQDDLSGKSAIDYNSIPKELKNEQDPQYQLEEEKGLTFATEMNRSSRTTKTNQNLPPILDANHPSASQLSGERHKIHASNLRDSGTSIITANSDLKDPETVPSSTSSSSPLPLRTTSSPHMDRPNPAHLPQSTAHHYYPQQQPQHHDYTAQANQGNYEAPLDDSFFHQDNNTIDKVKPPSSSCCCIIS